MTPSDRYPNFATRISSLCLLVALAWVSAGGAARADESSWAAAAGRADTALNRAERELREHREALRKLAADTAATGSRQQMPDYADNLRTLAVGNAVGLTDPLTGGMSSAGLLVVDGVTLLTSPKRTEQSNDWTCDAGIFALQLAAKAATDSLLGTTLGPLATDLTLANHTHKAIRSRLRQNETMKLFDPPLAMPWVEVSETVNDFNGTFKAEGPNAKISGSWTLEDQLGTRTYDGRVDYEYTSHPVGGPTVEAEGWVTRNRVERGGPAFNPFDLFDRPNKHTVTRRHSRTTTRFNGRQAQREIDAAMRAEREHRRRREAVPGGFDGGVGGGPDDPDGGPGGFHGGSGGGGGGGGTGFGGVHPSVADARHVPAVPSTWIDEPAGPAPGNSAADLDVAARLPRPGQRVVVVGDSPAARRLADRTAARLGAENVRHVARLDNDATMQALAVSFRADRILGVRGRSAPRRPAATPRPHRPLPMPTAPDLPTGGVGGVWLPAAADVDVTGGLNADNFAMIFHDERGRVDLRRLRMFVTAAWVVYFGAEGPGISIDPIAPGVDKHVVRYIGPVECTDLGRVMRETDYLMKTWSVGAARPDITGFRNPDDIAAANGVAHVNVASRFWFVPEHLRFRQVGGALLVDGGHMALRTEYLGGARGASPENEAFAAWFTDNYATIARRYPVFGELWDYAQYVALARHLKQEGVPMVGFLLANRHMVLTEQSPDLVDAFFRESDHFRNVTIEGGVDLAVGTADAEWVVDTTARTVFDRPTTLVADAGAAPNAPATVPARIRLGSDRTLSVVSALDVSPSVSSSDPARPYGTDVAIRRGGQPALEVARLHTGRTGGAFGDGWDLMLPLAIAPAGETTVDYANVRLPRTMVVTDRMTGQAERLVFNADRYRIGGWLPDEPDATITVGLFPMTDGSFRLADKLGNAFSFDPAGRFTEMTLLGDYRQCVRRKPLDIAAPAGNGLHLRPAGGDTVRVANVRLPRRLDLLDADGDRVASFAYDDAADTLRYRPTDGTTGFDHLAVYTDGSFHLAARAGHRLVFDPAGGLERAAGEVVRQICNGDQTATLDYALAADGTLHVTGIDVAVGDGGPTQRIAYCYEGDRLTDINRLATAGADGLQAESLSLATGDRVGR
ncbi:MAG: hypothetical protein ACOC95_09770 [Planctomycetota bacterium]